MGPPGHLHDAVEVHDRPPVAVRVAVQRRGTQGLQTCLPVGQGPAGPGIFGRQGLFDQAQKSVDIRIPNSAIDAPGAKAAGELGDAGRGFAGFGDRGGDEEKRSGFWLLVHGFWLGTACSLSKAPDLPDPSSFL